MRKYCGVCGLPVHDGEECHLGQTRIIVYFEGNFTPEEVEKCLTYLAETYRALGGKGLKCLD